MLLLLASFSTTSPAFGASTEFIDIESFFNKPQPSKQVLPYALNIESYPRSFDKASIRHLSQFQRDWVYQTRVKVGGKIYFRLVVGNYASLNQAKQQLTRLKKFYPEAWINVRPALEIQKLNALLAAATSKSADVPRLVRKKTNPLPTTGLTKKPGAKSNRPEDLLTEARQAIVNQDYARVISISNKVSETGSIGQKQEAMELAGVARERQKKFAQAIAIYKKFQSLYPDSELAPKIESRLVGLQTMRLEPRPHLENKKPDQSLAQWYSFGSIAQYYRNDGIERDDIGAQTVNSSLVSDINLFSRRNTDTASLIFRFDAGVSNNFIDDENDTRVSRAMISYTDIESDYQFSAGRQSRTAMGVQGRFDGIVFTGLAHADLNYSLYTGYPVASSYDGSDADRQFAGASIHFNPFDPLVMDVYFIHQQNTDLTDRQALGSEFLYRRKDGFFYGIIDYDIFYDDLNNFTAITNYRHSEKLSFDLTYDFRNSPQLTTMNAIQGQPVNTLEELKTLFSENEIYQLAIDRTSKSQNLFIGTHYQIDKRRQLYLNLTLSSIDSTVSSGGVDAIPASDALYLALDYSIRGFFSSREFTSLGFRLSDTDSSDTVSLRLRSRFSGSNKFRYDPRLRLDYRESKTTEVTQWILSPGFKISYRLKKNLEFETSLDLEFSDYNLPNLDNQQVYRFFLGYHYQF